MAAFPVIGTAQEADSNAWRRATLAAYEVGVTIPDQLREDGFDVVAPLDGLIGIMKYEAELDSTTYWLGYHQDPPDVGDFARQMASTSWEFLSQQGGTVSWSPPYIAELEGTIRVAVCVLRFNGGVLSDKECSGL